MDELEELKDGVFVTSKMLEACVYVNLIFEKATFHSEYITAENKDLITEQQEEESKESKEDNLERGKEQKVEDHKFNYTKEDEICIPDFVTFLMILDINYPEEPPKILLKTNVYKMNKFKI